MKTRTRIAPAKLIWLLAPLSLVLAFGGCTEKKVKAARGKTGTGTSSEPDKVLYDRAEDDLKHNRYDEARLALQTLINTYPDSEYLAKAKLATADSYFKQGGPTGLSQAIAQYQDFITFFPFLDEAAYAQVQIANAHYRAMEKPDRDRNEALEAEGAFQTFLQKYPNSPLAADGQQKLRDVQEVLAEGDFAVAHFYFVRHADRASGARLAELVDRYPLFSEADRANWMLATLFQRAEKNDAAGQYFARIVKDYPLSPLAADSKDQLVKLGVPVPQADPTAMARMQQEQQTPRPAQRGGLLRRPEGALRSAPDVSMAARFGTPTMTPENSGSGETMNPGGSLAVGIAGSGANGAANGAASSATPATGAVVETVVPGSAASSGSSASQPAPDATATVATPGDSGAAAGSDSAGATSTAASSDSSGDSSAATTTTTQNTTPNSTGNSNQSSSKKKKGLKKLFPF